MYMCVYMYVYKYVHACESARVEGAAARELILSPTAEFSSLLIPPQPPLSAPLLSVSLSVPLSYPLLLSRTINVLRLDWIAIGIEEGDLLPRHVLLQLRRLVAAYGGPRASS